ncbi:MAG TPA: biotin carboxylase N-terminal domain-containing protein [Burkholderiales bacterium]|nr:biotin carboxylase N-terminal domain-containing protein [Burkholderiales bacterium]
MFKSLLIANRGEIAVRVARTARRMGIATVAVYSDADRDAPHVRAADRAVHIGPASPRESYLDIAAILAADADAVHPGYGFLSENPAFAEAVIASGRAWVGPPPAAMRALGDKANAKKLAAAAGVPVLPTYEREPEFPLVIKAVAGGGGRGMRLVRSAAELDEALVSAKSEAAHAFGDDRVILERAILAPRHVEVQVFADTQGHCVHLGERDCSVQRRHQKLIEESPSPAADAKLREKLGEAAVAVARAAGYVGAGTVEFLLDETGDFWFIEANARLQVEHPVTEMVTGLDLVEWQLRVAAGEPLPLAQKDIRFAGHAIEARLCTEDPARSFLPQSGRLARWQPATGVRVDHALESGMEIPSHYDSLAAKIIAHAPTRKQAREKLAAALDATVALGVPTNKAFLAAVLRDPVFAGPGATTGLLAERFAQWRPPALDEALARALYVKACAEAARAEVPRADGAHRGATRAPSPGYGEWAGWSNMARAQPPEAPYALEGAVLHFQIDGHAHAWRDTTMDPPERAVAGLADGRLAAPMNGRVVAVHAKAGERVEGGRALVVLEAMKMEHTLAAPAAVRVKAVHVAKGAQVAPGKLLMEFEPA